VLNVQLKRLSQAHRGVGAEHEEQQPIQWPERRPPQQVHQHSASQPANEDSFSYKDAEGQCDGGLGDRAWLEAQRHQDAMLEPGP
jgi:hypothetical protein